MAVKIGSARHDERGKITGGKAGDQTGKEVSTQDWYAHKKKWVVYRAKDPEKAAKIAATMKAACANKNIGYDQHQRNTLYEMAKKVGFAIALISVLCETDCSALVRVCCAAAGINTGDFTTANEGSALMATGEFVKLTEAKYTAKPHYLRAGDILVTKAKGHTAVVLTDGPKASDDTPALPQTQTNPTGNPYPIPERTLRLWCKGKDVKWLRWCLKSLGYKIGVGGGFGTKTRARVKAFQRDNGLKADGVVNKATRNALLAKIDVLVAIGTGVARNVE